MDSKQFAKIARHLTNGATRRGLLARLSALPLGVALAALLGDEESEAGRRKRRRARHHRRKNRRQRNRKRKGKGKNKGKNNGKNKDKGKPPTCQCSATQICDDGVCKTCDVCDEGCTHNTVPPAIEAAEAGDTIRICPSTFLAGITIAKNLTIIGAGSEATFLIANLETDDSVIAVQPNTVVTLQGLQLAEARDVTDGGGLHNQGKTTLTDCLITQNAALRGGGIYNDTEDTLILDNTDVTNNTADDGERFSQGGGIYNHRGFIQMTGGTVKGNKALHENGQGGGIYNTGEFDLTNSSVTGNFSGGDGGGIFNSPHDPTARVILTNSSVTNNDPNNCNESVPGCIN